MTSDLKTCKCSSCKWFVHKRVWKHSVRNARKSYRRSTNMILSRMKKTGERLHVPDKKSVSRIIWY